MSGDDDEQRRKAEKKAKKAEKRKREEEAESAAATAAAAATIAEDDAKGVNKRHKKEKKEKDERKEKKSKRDEPEPAAVAAAPMEVDSASSEESEKAAKKAAKKAKKAADAAEADAAIAQAQKEEAEELATAEAEAERLRKEKKAAKKASKESSKATSTDASDEDAAKAEKKRAKKEKKEAAAREAAAAESGVTASSAPAAAASAPTDAPPAPKVYPPPPPGNVTLLLFYQYVRPSWTLAQRQEAENFARDSLTRHGCTGRLRCAREGFNSTLTGPADGIRAFADDLRAYQPETFGETDFKFTDGLRDNQMLRGLKVWHVEELVTYGFGAKGVAPIESGGTHLKPRDWHDKAAEENTVLIDVRNANENAIGRFQPLNDASRVLDPNMRTSTEFPEWVDENMDKLKSAKQIMMYCTGGIRCERASALLVQKGLPAQKVYQLEGGIHRYLEDFPDGGHWVGKNYVFDRRFAHGATTKTPEVVGRCACCTGPWDRYQAAKKCALCRMEVLVCRECERSGKMKTVTLKCHLCGGPKPSYLPADDKTLKFKKKKVYGTAKAEADY